MAKTRHAVALAWALSALTHALPLHLRGDRAEPSLLERRSIFDTLISSAELDLTRTTEGWYVATAVVSGKSVQLAIDTGSEVFWVRKAKLAAGAANSSTLSTHRSSSDAWGFVNAAQSQQFSVQYGRGHVAGEVQDLQVQMGGEVPNTCQVGRATDETGIWANQHTIDGVLGLACDRRVAAASLRCFFGKKAKDNVISLQLRKDGGKLSLGVIPAEYRLSLYFMPPARECGKWKAPLLALSMPDAGRNVNKLSAASHALLDSGTNSIVGPTFDVIALTRSLGATPAPSKDGFGGEVTFYNIPCAARITLPQVTLTLGAWGSEANVTLSGEDLVSEGTEDSETCRLRIAGWETESWILGAAFLERLTAVVFNLDRHQVGLAV